MPVERVQSNKKSCDQSHVTEGQEIFLRIFAEVEEGGGGGRERVLGGFIVG